MHTALSAAVRGTGNWARIAAANDYADQSHLIRDFKALLGEAPGSFLRRGVTA
jgi:AraC-like DNA-binding protein